MHFTINKFQSVIKAKYLCLSSNLVKNSIIYFVFDFMWRNFANEFYHVVYSSIKYNFHEF